MFPANAHHAHGATTDAGAALRRLAERDSQPTPRNRVVSGGGASVQRDGAWPCGAGSHTVIVAVLACPGEATTALGHSRRTTARLTSLVLA
jgi:hypothetical protein